MPTLSPSCMAELSIMKLGENLCRGEGIPDGEGCGNLCGQISGLIINTELIALSSDITGHSDLG